MNLEDMASVGIVRLQWVYDRVNTSVVPPRFIGRTISFDYFESDNPENYESTPVLGTLDAVIGKEFIVSGEGFNWDRMSNTKVWRKVIKNGND